MALWPAAKALSDVLFWLSSRVVCFSRSVAHGMLAYRRQMRGACVEGQSLTAIVGSSDGVLGWWGCLEFFFLGIFAFGWRSDEREPDGVRVGVRCRVCITGVSCVSVVGSTPVTNGTICVRLVASIIRWLCAAASWRGGVVAEIDATAGGV